MFEPTNKAFMRYICKVKHLHCILMAIEDSKYHEDCVTLPLPKLYKSLRFHPSQADMQNHAQIGVPGAPGYDNRSLHINLDSSQYTHGHHRPDKQHGEKNGPRRRSQSSLTDTHDKTADSMAGCWE